MSKTYRRWEPGQSLLFPPSPLDWVPEGHLARFLLDVVDSLDLSGIYAYYEREERGYPGPPGLVCGENPPGTIRR